MATLRMVSMNSAQCGALPGQEFSSYLRYLLEDVKPDLCVLPGNIPDKGKTVVVGYDEFSLNGMTSTIMLYNAKRLTIKQGPSWYNLGTFPGIDLSQLVCPTVEIYGPGSRTPDREFSLITWNYEMCTNGMDRRTQAESLINFSHVLAAFRQRPVFVAGDFNLDAETVSAILSNSNKKSRENFMTSDLVQNGLDPTVWLPSMQKGATREMRHDFELQMLKASSSQFFLSSKNLAFPGPPKELRLESSAGRMIDMKPVFGPERPPPKHKEQTGCKKQYGGPIQTEMNVRPPPARHHGG